MRFTVRLLAFTTGLIVFMAGSAGADCYVKSTSTSDGFGGLGATEGTSETWVSGGRMAEKSQSHLKNSVLKALTKDSRSYTITRLDKGLIWDVDLGDKSYTEFSFAQMKEQMEKSAEEFKKAAASQPDASGSGASTPKAPEGQKADVKVDVKKTGAKKKIAGYNTEETVLTLLSTFTDQNSDEKVTMKLTYDVWLAADAPCAADMQELAKQFGATAGADMKESGAMFAAALSSAGISMDEFQKTASELTGYPMQTTMTIGADLSPEQMAQIKAAQAKAKQEREKEEEKDSGGGLSLGGFGKKLAAKAIKKDDKKEEESAPLDPGVLFRTTSTVEQVKSGVDDASVFEIPEGFKLKNH